MPRPETPAAPSRPASSPAPRALLVLGVVATALSLLGLLGALVAHFSGAAVPFLSALYALSLFGLPLGFGMLILHLVLSAVARSRA